MTILERIQGDVKDAMRARDTDRTTALRMLVAALQDEAKSKLRTLDEQEEIAVLTRERKRRAEAAKAFDDGGARDRADAERAQQQMIEAYLPEQLTDTEVDRLVLEAVTETGANTPAQMGMVMKAVMPKIAGRADGKIVSAAVQRALAGADSGGD
jgi:uncharacterized protein YqeY